MAVITRFIVVRNGVELDKVFDVKKEADAYDKMLDAAENLAVFIKKATFRFILMQRQWRRFPSIWPKMPLQLPISLEA